MKTLFCQTCLLIVLLVLSFSVHAQTEALQIDSLKKVLLTEKEDTNKVNTLNHLSYKYIVNLNNGEKGVSIANNALTLASKLNFKRG